MNSHWALKATCPSLCILLGLVAASLTAQAVPSCPKTRAPDQAWANLKGLGLVTKARVPVLPDSGTHAAHPVIADVWRLPSSRGDSANPILLSVALGPAEMASAKGAGCQAKAGGKTWWISIEDRPQPGADSVLFAVGRFNTDFAILVMISPADTWDQPTVLTFLDHLRVDARIK